MIYINGVAVVGDMFKATYDSNENDRIEKDALGITLNKLLKGAGVGVNPSEIDVPSAGAVLTVAETNVFNARGLTAWTDLNLSGVVGSNVALVILKIYIPSSGSDFTAAFRKNGDTDEFYSHPLGGAGGAAMTFRKNTTLIHNVAVVCTDTNGIIEYKITGEQNSVTIDIIAFIK